MEGAMAAAMRAMWLSVAFAGRGIDGGEDGGRGSPSPEVGFSPYPTTSNAALEGCSAKAGALRRCGRSKKGARLGRKLRDVEGKVSAEDGTGGEEAWVKNDEG